MNALWHVLLFALFFLCLPSGCVRPGAKSPAATATAGGVSVTQTGDASTPAKADTRTERAALVLPAGSEVWQDAKLGTLVYRLSRDTAISTEVRTESATAPQAFTPPLPPTPTEEAAGKAAWLYRIAIFAGGVAAVFGFLRGWDFVGWGGVAVCGGGLFGVFIERHPAILAVLAGGCAFAFAGVLAWHLWIKPCSPSPAPVTPALP